MYISEIDIDGFRNFRDVKIPLKDGINMIIGPNNAGKSNLLRAIALILNVPSHKGIDVNDIFVETDVVKLKEKAPSVHITLYFSQSEGESDQSEQVGILTGFLIDPGHPYKAQLNLSYTLPQDQNDKYVAEVAMLTDHQEIWTVLRRNYARFYELHRWGGNGQYKSQTMNDLFDRCDFQFLDAIRDVGRDMYMGYNPMLKEVLNFFVDYDIKSDDQKTEDEVKTELDTAQTQFRADAKPLMEKLMDRLNTGKDLLLEYAKDTGASFDSAEPDFSGNLSESELFAVLKLIIRYNTGVEIPATHNGLGYNNLIYMSLLLAKMQAWADGKYMHRQAKLFSLLAIEEPEAHLHPSMQYQFLNFLDLNKSKHNVNQILVTTHSTQIVSAVTVDDIICLHVSEYGKVKAGYPHKVYSNTSDDIESKAYVQRFLDATRSDIFFAKKLIFVEGVAEELLIPTFAKYLGYNLAKEHVLVVNMGGRYYKHFLKMFDRNNSFCIDKKVACISDIDPCCDGKSCYPFEYGVQGGRNYSHHADNEISLYATHQNIRYFRQDLRLGKTLEYEIMRVNPNCEMLILRGMKNEDELKDIMRANTLADKLKCLRDSPANKRIEAALEASNWSDSEKKDALIASRYLNSIGKGDNALALSLVLEENLKKPANQRTVFVVPQYIKDALLWLFQ